MCMRYLDEKVDTRIKRPEEGIGIGLLCIVEGKEYDNCDECPIFIREE